MEEIIETDPDWIFVATMGSSVQAAIDNLKVHLQIIRRGDLLPP